MRTDRLQGFGSTTLKENLKRMGAGKANWGRPGDELLEVALDAHDPAYDSAEELLEAAFGICAVRNPRFDWSAVAELTEEDESAMDEIEEAMRQEWMDQVESEQAELEAEAAHFFGEH